ncbi:hypothetical protein [Mycolicibacterium sp.]|uniref:hypothetical protein n=1 Tax=Mycolicibacterium sp. TaxID=2320850 RepID=UPI0037C62350
MTEQTAGIPRIFTLAEAAEQLRVSSNWLGQQLRDGRYAGLKQGNRWAMTEPQLLAAIEAMTRPVKEREPEPERYPGGLTRRSWQNLQRSRIPGTVQYNRRMGIKPKPVERSNVEPAPSWYKMVKPESDAVIAAMPELSGTQKALLERVEAEGEVAINGQSRKTVEALVRRGLVSYEVHHVLNSNSNGYIYRFTVRPKSDEPGVGNQA